MTNRGVTNTRGVFFTRLTSPGRANLFACKAHFFTNHFTAVVFNLPTTSLTVCRSVPGWGHGTGNNVCFDDTLASFLANVARPLRCVFLFITP